jgi:methionine salvage enolase-phosphatase E1
MMSQMERFEDALTELAKVRTVGHAGDHYAYMSGYLIGLIGEMARQSEDAQRLLERSLKDTEQMLFVANKMTEVDVAA